MRKNNITLVPCIDADGRIAEVCDFAACHSILPLDAILMAGGRGERLRPLTLTTPKPLLRIGGKCIIDYNVEELAKNGISNIAVTTNYLAEQIEEHFATPVGGVSVRCVKEPRKLGTIGAARLVGGLTHDNVLIMNSDLFTTINYEELYVRHIEEGADMTIAATPTWCRCLSPCSVAKGRASSGLKKKADVQLLCQCRHLHRAARIVGNDDSSRFRIRRDRPDRSACRQREKGCPLYNHRHMDRHRFARRFPPCARFGSPSKLNTLYDMSDRPLIFITNDDGINAEGIHQLIGMAAPLGEIIAVVPDSPRSGGSTAITCGAILRPKAYTSRDGMQIWTLNGTPADCVKLGLSALSPRRPDLLLSGINHGSNTGNSIVYSGTMGATLEGCLQKIDSIGFSLTSHRPAASDFQACRHVVETIVGMVLRDGLPENVCLNVNIPAGGVVKGYAPRPCLQRPVDGRICRLRRPVG